MRTELADARVRVRFPRPDDVDPLLEAVRESMAELMPWMPWCGPSYDRGSAAAWVERSPAERRAKVAYEFVVEDVTSGRFLGAVGVNLIDWRTRTANLGYWVRTSAHGMGIATAAGALAARFAFEDAGLERLEVVVPRGNVASERVARKLRARRQGIRRAGLVLHGLAHDATVFLLSRDDRRGTGPRM